MERKCGDCQLCCKLMPVRSLKKNGNQKCRFQKFHVGCTVYADLQRISPECRIWSCQWLVDPEVAGFPIRRPDHSHYVIDLTPDAIGVDLGDGRPERDVLVVQVWVDPSFPDAYKDPGLLAWLALRGERDHMPALIRYGGEGRDFVLAPPALTDGKQFIELRSNTRMEPDGQRIKRMMREGQIDVQIGVSLT